MAHVFLSEREIKTIIEEMYNMCHVAGLICELAYLRNMRAGDVRYLKVNHLRKLNGYPELYLHGDKTTTNQWFPCPNGIYDKIQDYIKKKGYKPEDNIFQVTKKHSGNYQGHTGVISRNWLIQLWYKACKKVGVYQETTVIKRNCKNCNYNQGQNNNRGKPKCNVLGYLKICDNVHINNCKKNGSVKLERESHPRIHESCRGVGAITKIKYYMAQGDDYEIAKAKIFNQSNWESWEVYNRYMNKALEKEIGDQRFVNDWVNKELI